MKNKAPLSLIEQLIMILVFALTAAFCLQGFTLANRISRHQEAQAKAVVITQNAAELLKYTSGNFSQSASILGGSVNGDVWIVPYDASWQLISSSPEAVYLLKVTCLNTDDPFLGTAQIQVLCEEEVIFEITTAWQEDYMYADT